MDWTLGLCNFLWANFSTNVFFDIKYVKTYLKG